eukprot:TRINITY_DN61756_c0_g1_i1.p2 TRINITY_DN61756_c0_g1~~TRINITY_DN61756_c0_g1_i1.p2  ORF type:complete len:161 (+),score=36.05 TRINITY_DN61756_c0_g1_i1:79-561(+)
MAAGEVPLLGGGGLAAEISAEAMRAYVECHCSPPETWGPRLTQRAADEMVTKKVIPVVSRWLSHGAPSADVADLALQTVHAAVSEFWRSSQPRAAPEKPQAAPVMAVRYAPYRQQAAEPQASPVLRSSPPPPLGAWDEPGGPLLGSPAHSAAGSGAPQPS